MAIWDDWHIGPFGADVRDSKDRRLVWVGYGEKHIDDTITETEQRQIIAVLRAVPAMIDLLHDLADDEREGDGRDSGGRAILASLDANTEKAGV